MEFEVEAVEAVDVEVTGELEYSKLKGGEG